MRVPKGGVLLREFPRAEYKRLDSEAFDLLVMDLAERGGDSSVTAILRTLHEQLHDREQMAQTAQMARTTCWIVAILALIALLVPITRLRLVAAISDVLILLFFGSGMYLWLRRKAEFKLNADEMVRIRNGALTALVRIVQSGNLSPTALDRDDRHTLVSAMRATGRLDPELQALLELRTPSNRSLRYRNTPDL